MAKTYTLSELKALAQTEVVGYQHWKNGSEKVIASNLYATVGSLLADAGVEFGRGAMPSRRLRPHGTSPRRSPMRTAASISIMSTKTARPEVPAAILISWNTGSGTPRTLRDRLYLGSLRFAYGITEQQYADQSAQGKRLASQRGHG